MNTPGTQTRSTVLVEVCVESTAAVRTAARAGADRVELCAALGVGGLTPSHAAVERARAAAEIGLVVLVRPRAGDFLYDEDELEIARRDIELIREAGADGVAIGALTADGEIDEPRTAALIECARPMEVTFHRAFDMTRDPLQALEALARLGVDRLLSSGQESTAERGVELLAQLVESSLGRLSVMPGGGVRPENVAAIVKRSCAAEVHFSATRRVVGPMRWRNPRCSMGSEKAADEYQRELPDEERIRGVLAALGR